MTTEATDRVAGKPIRTIGDESFSWRWYDNGLVVGFSRSAGRGNLESAWVAQTEGTYAGGRLSIGDKWSRAKRLFGKGEQSAGQPTVHLENGAGVCLDILASGDQVACFVLYLPPGGDPDVRQAGYESGTMPAFRLSKEGGIRILPSTPGNTVVYLEYDSEGGSTVVRSTAMEPVVLYGRLLVPFETTRGEAPPVTLYYEFTGDIATFIADTQLGLAEHPTPSPTRIYPGLEWSDSSDTCRVIGRQGVAVQGGLFPEAHLVECSSTLSHTTILYYYVDGIGLVKEDGKLELSEFIPGKP